MEENNTSVLFATNGVSSISDHLQVKYDAIKAIHDQAILQIKVEVLKMYLKREPNKKDLNSTSISGAKNFPEMVMRYNDIVLGYLNFEFAFDKESKVVFQFIPNFFEGSASSSTS